MAATTVDEYLDQLAPEAREQVAPVVALVRERVPAGYEEALAHGMPTWQVPLGDVIAALSPAEFMARHEAGRARG
jgi:hypothetical protein